MKRNFKKQNEEEVRKQFIMSAKDQNRKGWPPRGGGVRGGRTHKRAGGCCLCDWCPVLDPPGGGAGAAGGDGRAVARGGAATPPKRGCKMLYTCAGAGGLAVAVAVAGAGIRDPAEGGRGGGRKG